jgi:integrase
MAKHSLMGGKLLLYKRPNSSYWQCSTYLAGDNRRKSTNTESLEHAKDVAQDWYLTLLGKHRTGDLKSGKTFEFVAGQFLKEYEVLTEGQRSPKWINLLKRKLDNYLIPYFGSMVVGEITPGKVQEYRIDRAQKGYWGTPPARNTIEHELIALRQVLKTAVRHRWLEYVPDFSPPFRASRKVSHRAWFSREEYRSLYQATRERSKNPDQERWRWCYEQVHDKVLFLANTGLRPDEAGVLQLRDVKIVKDGDTGETILEIEVHGKTGVGYCKSMPGAVAPFIRLRKRNDLKPTDRLFPNSHERVLNKILEELNLKFDRDGRPRSFYSLRHSYICFRLMEGADIYQVAKNCRTSVEMIQKHYAAHIKNMLNAAKINTRRPRPAKRRTSHKNRPREILVHETMS